MSQAVNNRPIAAALAMLCAMSVIGLIDNVIGLISAQISLWQFVALRSVLMVPILLGVGALRPGTLWPIRWRPVLARSVVLGVSMFLYFGSLGLMPIAQALAGLFTSPIFVLLINVLWMKQRIGPWRIVSVFIGFGGILMVLQPGSEGFGLVMILPVAAGLFYAVSSVATRSWCAGESALALLMANMALLGLGGGIVALGLEESGLGGGDGFMSRSWSWDFLPVMPWLVVQAVGSLLGVFLIVRAYQMDEPTNVAVFEYSIMIFAPGFAWVFFRQALDHWQIIGIALIALAGLIIALRSK